MEQRELQRPLSHPFRLIIAGKSGSGKTNLLMNLLLNEDYYNKYFDRIFVFSPTYYQDPLWKLVPLPSNQVFTSYNDATLNHIFKMKREVNRNIDSTGKPVREKWLIIGEDIGADRLRRGNYNNALDKSQMIGRHFDMSYIWLVQKLASLSTPTRDNADAIAMFESTSYNELQILYKDWGKGRLNQFLKVMDIATTEPYSFLFIRRQGPKTQYSIKFHSIIHINGGRSREVLVESADREFSNREIQRYKYQLQS